MTLINSVKDYLKYAKKQRRYWIYLALFVFIASILHIFFAFITHHAIDESFLNTYLGLLGIIFTIWVLVVNLREEWIRDLPKKLTVHFIVYEKETDKDNYKMSAYDAPLLSKDDIRAWSQQIGSTICTVKPPILELKYFEFTETAKIVEINNVFYEHFEIKYYVGNNNLKEGYVVREYLPTSDVHGKILYDYDEKHFEGVKSESPKKIIELEEDCKKQNPA